MEIKMPTEQALKELDNFPNLSAWNKADLIGVYADIKPVAYVYSDQNGTPDFEKLKEVMDILEIKICHEITTVDVDNHQHDFWKIFAAKDADLIRDFKAAYRKSLSVEEGRLLGYPATSTQALIGKIPRISPAELAEIYQDDPVVRFAGMILSREHCQAEVEAYARKIMQATKKYLPNSYKMIMAEKIIL